jgi:hypothetical protein
MRQTQEKRKEKFEIKRRKTAVGLKMSDKNKARQ